MDSKGKEITNYGDYTVETSNKDILIIGGSLSDSTAGISLTPVAEGSAALIVKKDNKTVVALPIVVLAERKVNRIALNKDNFTLSTATGAPSEKVTLTVTDQYGEKMDKSKFESEIKVKELNGVSGIVVTPDTKQHNDEFNFSAAGATGVDAGKNKTCTYKVCVGEFERPVTIKVATPDTSVDPKLNINLSEMTKDAVVKSKDDINKTINVSVENLYNGVFGNNGLGNNSVKLYKGNDEVTKLDGDAGVLSVVDSTSNGATINVTKTTTDGVTYKLAAGTYTVKVVDTKGTVLSTKSFSVTDSQDKVTAVRDSAKFEGAKGDDAMAAVAKCFKFKCGSKTSRADNTGDVKVVSVAFNNGQTFGNGDKSVKEAVVTVEVATDVKVAVTVALNQTITISGVE